MLAQAWAGSSRSALRTQREPEFSNGGSPEWPSDCLRVCDAVSSGPEEACLGVASVVTSLFQSSVGQGAVHVAVPLHFGPTASLVSRVVHKGNVVGTRDFADLFQAQLSHIQATGNVVALAVDLVADHAFGVAEGVGRTDELLEWE